MSGQSRFLEASLVRQADGKLKKMQKLFYNLQMLQYYNSQKDTCLVSIAEVP